MTKKSMMTEDTPAMAMQKAARSTMTTAATRGIEYRSRLRPTQGRLIALARVAAM